MNDDTIPENERPSDPNSQARLFAELVGHMLEPLRADLEAIKASVGLSNGQTRSLSGRVTDLEDRMDRLEDEA